MYLTAKMISYDLTLHMEKMTAVIGSMTLNWISSKEIGWSEKT